MRLLVTALVVLLAAVAVWLVLILHRQGKHSAALLRSVTRLIFVSTQISALVWVYTSYGIAIFSTVHLGQVYTMAELSEPAIHTILGVSFLKVLENIFEHNNGPVFGRSKDESEDTYHDKQD